MIHIEVAARTHIGNARTENQDAFFVAETLYAQTQDATASATFEQSDLACLIAGVADGIGGHPCGAEASAIALQEILPCSQFDRAGLTQALLRANKELYAYAAQAVEKTGMGTTAAIMSIHNTMLEFASVGDSFIAQITPRFVRPLMRSIDQICESSVLDAALGGSLSWIEPKIEYAVLDGLPGRYFLATDGIVRYASWEALREILIDASVPIELTVAKIFDLVLGGKALDNATCALIEVVHV